MSTFVYLTKSKVREMTQKLVDLNRLVRREFISGIIILLLLFFRRTNKLQFRVADGITK